MRIQARFRSGGGVSGGLGLSMQESGGWANLPATTRPLQRVQPKATQASIAHGQPTPGSPVGRWYWPGGQVGYSDLRSSSSICHLGGGSSLGPVRGPSDDGL